MGESLWRRESPDSLPTSSAVSELLVIRHRYRVLVEGVVLDRRGLTHEGGRAEEGGFLEILKETDHRFWLRRGHNHIELHAAGAAGVFRIDQRQTNALQPDVGRHNRGEILKDARPAHAAAGDDLVHEDAGGERYQRFQAW